MAIFTGALSVGSHADCYAAEPETAQEENAAWETNTAAAAQELIGYSQEAFYDYLSEENASAKQAEPQDIAEYDICGLFPSKEEIVLDTNGCVDYIDIIGMLSDGGYVNLSNQVKITVEDDAVASYFRGRIYGEGTGTTVITAEYGGYEAAFQVSVKEYFDYDALMQELISGGDASTYSLTSTQVQETMSRANSMMHYVWKAEARFRLNDGTYAEAGTQLEGMPYELLQKRCTLAEFIAYYNAWSTKDNGFYKENPRPKQDEETGETVIYYDATYGIDCSGFLCNAWNISSYDVNTQSFYDAVCSSNSSCFEKVGSYSANGTYSVGNVSKSELKTAYASLKAGDAIVRRKSNGGHARLVMSVNLTNQTVTTVEAFGNFPNYATYTFDQLADDYYCPFAVKSSYYNSLK